MTHRFDVVIAGAGPAGLSAALVLGRARRRVLLADGGRPRNACSPSVHGYLTQDGARPADFLARAAAEVAAYRVERAGPVDAIRPEDGALTVTLADGRTVAARRVVLATGVTDALPELPGLPARWGRDVLHCPYCHGYEVRDRPLGVLAGDPEGAVHQGLLLRQWSADIRIFLNHLSPDSLDPHAAALLEARGVRMVPGPVRGLEVRDDVLRGVTVEGIGTVPCEALFVPLRLTVNDLPSADLRLERSRTDMGECIATDDEGRTSVPRVWAAGNVADLSAQVIGAAESGARAAIAINGELVHEDAEAALASRASAVGP